MRLLMQLISWVSLIVLIVPSIMYLTGKMELDRVKWIMLIATIVWFASASLWMWNGKDKAQAD